MKPLQKIAMGLVIVLADPFKAGFDVLPDVLGWVLVVLGLLDLRTALRNSSTLLTLAVLAGAVSAVVFWPPVADGLPESAGWLLSLPQLAFSVVLCGDLAALLANEAPESPRRLAWLRWAFVVAAVGPLLLYGGGVDSLLVPLAVLTVAANVYLVYLLFKYAGRPAVSHSEAAA